MKLAYFAALTLAMATGIANALGRLSFTLPFYTSVSYFLTSLPRGSGGAWVHAMGPITRNTVESCSTDGDCQVARNLDIPRDGGFGAGSWVHALGPTVEN
ncbi:hypothetical protein V5O48_017733 [Marasmius crinis-equi]|uniref:Uncharacterized protein n=1 Tax=Marasmius crinis-equi TaxID=585013 RepID=A0ABR3EN99_9AGAR